ncbi:MAG: sodium:proton antiporter [Bacteroidetes bacterium]|nr:sodium:proton antiporter [Bacteroidota bacterium]
MTTEIIIAICGLILLAYLFDVTVSITRIPSVILLLIVGWSVRQLTILLQIPMPDIAQVLPVIGTVGLILIVLEGSLELELSRSKLGVISKTITISLLSVMVFSLGLAFVFQYFSGVSLKIALVNAIPFAVISSAIAIPTAQKFLSKDREFITYESSFSDIIGVILFNFLILNETIGLVSVGQFLLEMTLILLITLVTTLLLALLLGKLKHHVKYLPIIVLIVLIYSLSKLYHLPALIIILLFGLFLGNLNKFRRFGFISRLHPDGMTHDVHKFRDLTVEIAFLVRVLFFLLFGYQIQTSDLINLETLVWALGISLGIYGIRYGLLLLYKVKSPAVFFTAPRGLITILLFLSIPASQVVPPVSNSLIIQVILISAMMLMIGMIGNGGKEKERLEVEPSGKN